MLTLFGIGFVICFLIGWVQEAAVKEQSRATRYRAPQVTPAQPKPQKHTSKPRKIILPDALTAEELAEFGPRWLTK